jgi:hypothetical protein
MRFFRWLYSPDLPPRNRPKPAIMENIPKLRRKEISIYGPLIYGQKRMTPYFSITVLLQEIDAGTPYLVTPDADRMNF